MNKKEEFELLNGIVNKMMMQAMDEVPKGMGYNLHLLMLFKMAKSMAEVRGTEIVIQILQDMCTLLKTESTGQDD
jgi:hypothetical protein